MEQLEKDIASVKAYKQWPVAPHTIMAKAYSAVSQWINDELLPVTAHPEEDDIVEQMETAYRQAEQEKDVQRITGEKE